MSCVEHPWTRIMNGKNLNLANKERVTFDAPKLRQSIDIFKSLCAPLSGSSFCSNFDWDVKWCEHKRLVWHVGRWWWTRQTCKRQASPFKHHQTSTAQMPSSMTEWVLALVVQSISGWLIGSIYITMPPGSQGNTTGWAAPPLFGHSWTNGCGRSSGRPNLCKIVVEEKHGKTLSWKPRMYKYVACRNTIPPTNTSDSNDWRPEKGPKLRLGIQDFVGE